VREDRQTTDQQQDQDDDKNCAHVYFLVESVLKSLMFRAAGTELIPDGLQVPTAVRERKFNVFLMYLDRRFISFYRQKPAASFDSPALTKVRDGRQ
jgi:hypothetical protein